MTFPESSDPVVRIYLALNQYPILAGRIRAHMRRELFHKGIILPDAFEAEAKEKAIQSQVREGLHNPYGEESAEFWETRLARIHDSLTDFYFAYNLPYEEFERIVRETLTQHGSDESDFVWFNPELAPQDMLFDQAENIEAMPLEERKHYEARLQEIKVVLIRTMVSDHMAYLKIARKWFTVNDLKGIRKRKIGGGKIGGKAAGMLLAMRILTEAAPEISAAFKTPTSYYLGSDVFYNFMSFNALTHWNDQKYKPEEEIRRDYPLIHAEFSKGQFPEFVIDRLHEVLDEAGDRPLIVRSSSLLEDNFGTSFAGKYESIFCPNQASREENLSRLTQAIANVYASALNPDALIYRHHKNLADYDERIAILIQIVEGERFGDWYLPHGSGVAFSRNLYRWSPQIKAEDGFVRLVWGLGTRAVDQTGNDHPRLVALSHPTLHPASEIKAIQTYSQKFVDVINLKTNAFETVPVEQILSRHYPPLRYVAQVDQGGYLTPLRTNIVDTQNLVVTFDELLRRTPFAALMKIALNTIEAAYHSPIDSEFVVRVEEGDTTQPRVTISILQCRPQAHMDEEAARLPDSLAADDILFSTRRMVPRGAVKDIRCVLFVSPEGYFNLQSQDERHKLERAIGELNTALKGQTFICVGPGRWGTSTPDLGVHIRYGDIYNTRALVELSGQGIGTAPEPSFGTHFFQDLMEAKIFPLAVYLDDTDAIFNWNFFNATPNRLGKWIKPDKSVQKCLRLIEVADFRPKHHVNLIMDDAQGKAVAFLRED
jgi:hypothetical protein